MLGIFSAISSFYLLLLEVVERISLLGTRLWLFFEQYGWRLLIGLVSAWYFIQRIWLERERREKIAHRALAADPSRVAALNARRAKAVDELGGWHSTSIIKKKKRDEEIRMRRLRELERRIVGGGRRLGSN